MHAHRQQLRSLLIAGDASKQLLAPINGAYCCCTAAPGAFHHPSRTLNHGLNCTFTLQQEEVIPKRWPVRKLVQLKNR